jgi:hypothetical protein
MKTGICVYQEIPYIYIYIYNYILYIVCLCNVCRQTCIRGPLCFGFHTLMNYASTAYPAFSGSFCCYCLVWGLGRVLEARCSSPVVSESLPICTSSMDYKCAEERTQRSRWCSFSVQGMASLPHCGQAGGWAWLYSTES